MKQKVSRFLVTLFIVMLSGTFMVSCFSDSDSSGDAFDATPTIFEGTWKIKTGGINVGDWLIFEGNRVTFCSSSGGDWDRGLFTFNSTEIIVNFTQYSEDEGQTWKDYPWKETFLYELEGSDKLKLYDDYFSTYVTYDLE